MGEDDDRRARGLVFEIVGEPSELVGSQPSEAAGLEVNHIDETDEVHAVVVEAVPALPLGAFAVPVEISLAQALVDEVVLARNVVYIELGLADDLIGVVEFVRLGQMGNVARMDHKGRAGLHRLHLADGFAKCAESVRIGGFVEADMAVADLQESEAGGHRRERINSQPYGFLHSTAKWPQNPSPSPTHA